MIPPPLLGVLGLWDPGPGRHNKGGEGGGGWPLGLLGPLFLVFSGPFLGLFVGGSLGGSAWACF